MGHYTEYTARWLDRRYAQVDEAGRYFSHMPIYGPGHEHGEGSHGVRFARLFQILRELDRLEFGSCLDVGGGEGYVSFVVREMFGADVVSCDLSKEACVRARQLFDVDAVAMDSARLPFPDNSFDVVMCSEVVEHLEFAVECLMELQRVARFAVVLSTEELEPDREKIRQHLFRRCGYPHYERNLLHPSDLELLFDSNIELKSQIRALPDGTMFPDGDAEGLRSWILDVTPKTELLGDGFGVVARCLLDSDALRSHPRLGDDVLLDRLLDEMRVPFEALPTPAEDPRAEVLERCVCPRTRGALSREGAFFVGPDGARYALENGVPILYDLGAPDPTTEDLRTALTKSWDDPARIEEAVALREALVLPMVADKLEWDFSQVEDRRGWMPAESMAEVSTKSGGLRFRASDADPWIAGPGLWLAAADIVALHVRMSTHNPDYPLEGGEGQVFWLTDEDTTLDEAHSVTFPIRNEDRVNEYRIELTTSAAWASSGRIIFLRIDPANGPCDIDVRGFRIEQKRSVSPR